MMRRLALAGMMLGLLLGGCSGSDKPDEDPFKAFLDQEVSWERCDPQLYASDLDLLEPILDRLECATVQTPLDWEDKESLSVNLGVLRVRAADAAARKGAIFMNPGGPGGDGLFLAAIYGLIFDSASDLGIPAPESFKTISESYDIVGFSPRGVGESLRLYCGSNKLLPADVNFFDRDEANLDKLILGGRYIAEACLANPFTRYVDTEQTVYDMDLLRQLLGDENLNYLGFSYGSWLGAWYAKTFPEHSGNIVLDANTEFSATFKKVFDSFQMGFDLAFRNVALAYVARNSAIYELGPSKEEVFEVFLGLPAIVKEAFVYGFVGVFSDLYSSASVPNIGFKLMAAQGVAEVRADLGPDPDLGELLTAVDAYTYSADEDVNAVVADYAFEMAFDTYIFSNASPAPVELTSPGALQQTVICNDSPWPNDPGVYKADARAAAEAYPILGVSAALQPCAYWTEATTSMPDVPADLPPILMVQTGFDGPTPAEGAFRAFETLPNARLIYTRNEMSHASFPYGTDCVDENVAAYLLDGSLPGERITECEAFPLPGEDRVYPPEGGVDPADAQVSLEAVLGPRPGHSLYAKAHALIHKNAADFFGTELRQQRARR